jgi:N-acetylglucosaminyl-diphospho-decaprenol L-rhamnosyltransferase
MTELSVVLVNYNGASVLPRSLGALAENTRSKDVECIVVDSGSADDSWRNVEQHWEKARALRLEENVGFCAACNRGVEAASGGLIAFVNFDGEAEPGWDVPLRALLEDPSVAVASGILLAADGATVEAAGLEIAPNMATWGRLEGTQRATLPAGPFDVPAASGALMMVRRDEFLALGGFYEPIFMYGEEADYCLRAGGRIVVDPGSALRHEVGHAAGPPRSPLRLYYGSRNRLVNAARHLPAPRLLESIAASAAFDALTLAQLRDRAAVAAVARGWRDGLRSLRRERAAVPPATRRSAARKLGSLRDAVSQQRRLGRV